MVKKEEKEISEGVTLGYELKSLEPSSTEDYTIWSVEKVYFNIHFRIGTDDHTAGVNFVPTYGHEVRVALANGNVDIEEVPQGVILEADFTKQFVRLSDTLMGYRSRTIAATAAENNPVKGF